MRCRPLSSNQYRSLGYVLVKFGVTKQPGGFFGFDRMFQEMADLMKHMDKLDDFNDVIPKQKPTQPPKGKKLSIIFRQLIGVDFPEPEPWKK